MSLQNDYKNNKNSTNMIDSSSSSDQLMNNNGSSSSNSSGSKSDGSIFVDEINQLIYNHDEHKSETMNMLNVLRKNRQLCDVIIQIDDNNNDIYCHQIILACNSKLFMELFLNYELANNNSTSPKSTSPTNEIENQTQQQAQHQNLRKTSSSSSSSTAINSNHNSGKATNANKQIIIQIKNYLNYKINEYTYGALKCCIQYMYTSQLRITNINLIKEVYCLAHSLTFQSIVDICSKHLIKHLNETNCLSIRCFARDEDLIQSSSLLIQTNIERLLATKQFINLPGINIELIGVKNKLTSKFNLNINANGNGNGNGNGGKGGHHSSLTSLSNGNYQQTTNDNSSFYDFEFNPIILNDLILKWLLTKRYSELSDSCDNINMLYLNDDKSLHDCCDMDETNKNFCDYIFDYQQKRIKNQHHYQQQQSQTLNDPINSKLPKFASFQITDSELSEFYDEYEPSSISNNYHHQSQQLLHDNEIICTSKINDTNFITICIINGRVLRLSIHLQPITATINESTTNDVNNINNESETYQNSQQQNQPQQQQQNDSNLLCNDNICILKSRSNSSIGNHEDIHIDPNELVRSHSEVSTDNVANNYIKKMLSARASHGVIPYNKKLFIIAGYDRGECLSKCELYDPLTNTVQQFSALNNKRGRAACVWFDKTKSIYVFGGSDGHQELYSLERYDLDCEKSKWTSVLFDIQFECTNIPACSDDDFIYFVGVKDSNNLQTHCLRYDPVSNVFSRISDMNAGRSQCALVRHNDLLYVFGGHDQIRCLNTCEVFNAKENKWNFIESMIKARRSCGAAEKNDLIYLVGGTNGSISLKSTEIYNVATNKFSIGPELNVARANVSIAFIGDMLYAVGGFDGKRFLNTIERLNINDINAGWSIYYNNNESL